MSGRSKAKTKGSIEDLAGKLMKKPGILARVAQLKREEIAIHERKHRTKVDAQRVLEKHAAPMNADIRRVASVADGRLTMRDSAEWYEEDADAIKSVSQTPDGLRNKRDATDAEPKEESGQILGTNGRQRPSQIILVVRTLDRRR